DAAVLPEARLRGRRANSRLLRRRGRQGHLLEEARVIVARSLRDRIPESGHGVTGPHDDTLRLDSSRPPCPTLAARRIWRPRGTPGPTGATRPPRDRDSHGRPRIRLSRVGAISMQRSSTAVGPVVPEWAGNQAAPAARRGATLPGSPNPPRPRSSPTRAQSDGACQPM